MHKIVDLLPWREESERNTAHEIINEELGDAAPKPAGNGGRTPAPGGGQAAEPVSEPTPAPVSVG